MKKLILKLLIFLLICVVVDRGVGAAMRWLMLHAQSGETYRNFYMFNEMDEDVLVFGSSRSIHHYNPKVISEQLDGMSCYNCGISGYGIILFYPRLMKIVERYQPKLIIYDVYSSFDLKPGDNHKYLRYVRQIEGCKAANEVLASIDPTERWKMMSEVYRLNSQLPQTIGDCLKKGGEPLRGFEPKYGVKQKITRDMKGNPETKINNAHDYDELKLHYLRLFVEECQRRNIALVFSYSPLAIYEDMSWYEPIKDMCNQYGIPFMDYGRLYDNQPEMFYDVAHMNVDGANAYSTLIAKQIKEQFECLK